MPDASSRILLALAATWAAALCFAVDPAMGLLTSGAFTLVEAARTEVWIEPGTAMAVVLIGWALFGLVLSRTTSPAATA